MFKKVACVVAILAVLVLGANDSAWAENLILNGGFENPDNGGVVGDWASRADNWDGTYYGRCPADGSFHAFEGNYSLHLDYRPSFYAVQTIPTEIDKTYELSFQSSGWAGHAGLAPGDPQAGWIYVTSGDGNTVYYDEVFTTPTGSDQATDQGWTLQDGYTFTAVSELTSIYLFNHYVNTANDSAVSIDAVSVSMVPEPGTWLLLLSGLLGLLIWRQRV